MILGFDRFLPTVVARPDDNLPRLIAADFLQERGRTVPCPDCAAFRRGDLVEPLQPSGALRCGSGIYRRAVVVSVRPFVLAAEAGDMLWRATLRPREFRTLGPAPEPAAAFARWERDRRGHLPPAPSACAACDGQQVVADPTGALAEFIRVQCELDGLFPGTVCRQCGVRAKDRRQKYCGSGDDKDYEHRWEVLPEYRALRGRERALLSQPRNFVDWVPPFFHSGPGAGIAYNGHADDWEQPVVQLTGRGFRSVLFRRGFIAEVGLDWRCWLEHHQEILAHCPIRERNVGTGERPAWQKGTGGLIRLTDWPPPIRVGPTAPQFAGVPFADPVPRPDPTEDP